MSLLRLCQRDEILTTLRDVFKANIVRIPEERIQPLCAITTSSKSTRYWGRFNELLSTEIDKITENIKIGQVADVSGKRSRSVDLDLGFQILEGFLSGFGLPSAGIKPHFKGAKEVSFSFQQVERHYIDPSKLGRLLRGQILDPENSANSDFFSKEADLLVIDSVIVSRDFNINVDKSNEQSFKLDVPAIQKFIGELNLGVDVSSNNNTGITFKGEKPLTFAFTCLPVVVDGAGTIGLKASAENPDVTLRKLGKTQEPEKVLINRAPGLLSWD